MISQMAGVVYHASNQHWKLSLPIHHIFISICVKDWKVNIISLHRMETYEDVIKNKISGQEI